MVVSKWDGMGWYGWSVCRGEKGNAYVNFVGKVEGKRPLQRMRHRWKDNVKVDHKEIGCEV